MRASSIARSASVHLSPLLVRALLLCVAPLALSAQAIHPTPSPILAISWGTTADSVIAQAGGAGWRFVRVDDDGDFIFEGSVQGERAVAFATFGTTGLTRIMINVAAQPSPDAIYEHLADTLRAQYGLERLVSGEDRGWRAAPGIVRANAWQGILMGLRRDGWISMVFTCPESSPKLPGRGDGLARA